MTYRLRRSENLEETVRRIAIEQIDKAVANIDGAQAGPNSTVHALRKRCKKVRGLLRLVEPVFGAYHMENAAFREAARSLSKFRDAKVLIDTHDSLMEAYSGQIDPTAFAPIREQLRRRREGESLEDIDSKLRGFRQAMLAAGARARNWQLDDDGFEAIRCGLCKSYKRARKALTEAQETGSPEALHEWRKRAKYHWYHSRLLRPIWSKPMRARAKAAGRLNSLLGDHHDLTVFADVLRSDAPAFGKQEPIDVILGLVTQRQTRLQSKATVLGQKLFAEKKGALEARWLRYWRAWQGVTESSGSSTAPAA